MNGRRSRQMKHIGIEDAFVWVISTGGDPVSHDIIAAAGPRLFLAVLNVRVCARSIGLHRYPPVPHRLVADSQTQNRMQSEAS